jgi:hypothetical protein
VVLSGVGTLASPLVKFLQDSIIHSGWCPSAHGPYGRTKNWRILMSFFTSSVQCIFPIHNTYMKCRGDPRGRPVPVARNNPIPVLKNTGQNARYLRGIFENHQKMRVKSLWRANVPPLPPTHSPSISLPAPRRSAPRHDDAISSETPPCVTSCRDHLAAGEWPRSRHPTRLESGQAG